MPGNSTLLRGPRKLRREHPSMTNPDQGYPLRRHASGRWVKKIRHQHHCIGPAWGKRKNGRLLIDGDGHWQQALEEYERQRDHLQRGLVPPPRVEAAQVTLADVCNAFMASKTRTLEVGQIGRRMFVEHMAIAKFLIETFRTSRWPSPITSKRN